MKVRLDIEAAIAALGSDLEIDAHTLETTLLRFRKEGFPFLSVALPKFSKTVVYAVSVGRLNDPNDPETCTTAFRWKNWTRLPSFLEVQLKKLFSRNGRLKQDYDPVALWVIRQYCEYFYKLATQFTEKDLEHAEKVFTEVDTHVGEKVDTAWVECLRKKLESHYHLSDTYDQIINKYKPRLTPGSFAGSKQLPGFSRHFVEFKRSQLGMSEVPTRSCGNIGALKPRPAVKFRDWLFSRKVGSPRQATPTSEVLFVPKDSRGPRTIAREPQAAIKWQMSYFDYLTRKLEDVTHGRVLFYDQSVHRDLACRGSIDGSWSTMDLKEASDRVPFSVVKALYRNLPIRKFLEFRTPQAKLPSGEVIWLKKLAGMGSGLTFPTMALLIHLTVCEAISRTPNMSFTKAMKIVYVYGDDLILPTKFAHLVSDALLKVGLKLNTSKSFTCGRFRESCGADFLRGHNVTPIRLKLAGADLPVPRKISLNKGFTIQKDVGILQLERHCRELVNSGLYSLAEYYYTRLEKALGRLPNVSGESEVLGRYTQASAVFCEPLGSAEAWVFTPDSLSIRPQEKSRGFLFNVTTVDNETLLSEVLRPTSVPAEVGQPCRGVDVPRRGKLRRTLADLTKRLGHPAATLLRSCKPGGLTVKLV